jgi:hypothetical protein
MSILKFSGKANPAASSANIKYISRERACDDLSFHNLPDLETRADAIAYAERRAEEESERPARGNGIQRNHHRMILSFDRTETTDAARKQAHEFMRENFPNARAAIAIHQDKPGQTHAHIWIDARSTDERKIRIDKATYKTLDERWAQQYDRHYGTDYEREYKEKKAETREWKRDRVAGVDRPKPARARDGMTADRYKEKDIRDAGVNSHELNEKRIDRNKLIIAAGQRCITDTHKQIDSGEREATRLQHELSETIAASKRLQHTTTGMDQANERTVDRASINKDLSR